MLLEHARRVFVALENAVAATRQASDPDSGLLRIGASITACQYIVPEALREFRESFPAYSLRITPGDGPLVTQGCSTARSTWASSCDIRSSRS